MSTSTNTYAAVPMVLLLLFIHLLSLLFANQQSLVGFICSFIFTLTFTNPMRVNSHCTLNETDQVSTICAGKISIYLVIQSP